MTTVTDSDIKEILEAASPRRDPFGIASLGKQINEVEKNLLAKISDVAGDLKAVKAQIDGLDKRVTDGLNNLDKRVTTQELIYRAFFIAIISLFTTGAISTLGPSIFKYFWNNPLFS